MYSILHQNCMKVNFVNPKLADKFNLLGEIAQIKSLFIGLFTWQFILLFENRKSNKWSIKLNQNYYYYL